MLWLRRLSEGHRAPLALLVLTMAAAGLLGHVVRYPVARGALAKIQPEWRSLG